MRDLIDILKESILDDIDTQINTGDDELIRHVYKVPKLEDFYRTRLMRGTGEILFWECGELIKPLRRHRIIPRNSAGLTFRIIPAGSTTKIVAEFNSEEGKNRFEFGSRVIQCWRTELDKNVLYCKKVILSIIEHLARNPKAFEEFMNYIIEYGRDKDARSSYDDGRPFPVRDFMELKKIKG